MKLILLYCFLFVFSIESIAQKDSVEFILVDTLTNQTDEYYLAGNINGWNPKDENYHFKKDEDGTRFLMCYFDKGTNLEFKFTRGNWQTVECNNNGADIQNHLIKTDTAKFLVYYIKGWKDKFSQVVKQHTASSQVKIIDTAFYIPQLNRNRRVWIYLPENYSKNLKKYPVLYMHDGQNVFDEYTSGFGEWGVDECLDSLINSGTAPCIVVAIDNGSKRLNEYNPFDNTQFGKGEGDDYMAFLVKTLKPYIDKNYRTLAGKENTIIAGSSMGGLISYYAALTHPEVFGKAGIFSPAFWIAPQLTELTDSLSSKLNGKFYFTIGSNEGQQYVFDMENIAEKLASNSNTMIYSKVAANENHNEKNWRNQFAEFYKWIMADGYNYVIKIEED